MKLTGITLLLLATASQAAPRVLNIAQAYQTEQSEEEPPIAVDFWPLGAFDSDEHYGDEDSSFFDDDSPFQGTLELNFDVNRDNMPILLNNTITNIIFKDLEQRIAEDVRRMQEDTLLFQKLFGRRQPVDTRPSWFMPWGIPDNTPVDSPSFFSDEDSDEAIYGHNNPLIPSFDNDDDDDDDSLFGGFPFLGIDRPLFPGLPNIPGVGFANPEDLPDNYSNETHEVHSVNGSQVVVNNTINKASGDDFSSFFHHQVIHYRPDQEEEGSVPAVSAIPVDRVHEEDDGNSDDEINAVLPSVENEINSKGFNPEAIPEVVPEITSDTESELHGSRLDESVVNEENFGGSNLVNQHGTKRIAARSLHEFNPIVFPADDPKSAALVSNSLTGEDEVEEVGEEARALDSKSSAYISNSLSNEEDFEEIEHANRPPPDLSNDTRVNRIHVNKQGMTRVDPDAEIFNYALVMEEAKPREGDK